LVYKLNPNSQSMSDNKRGIKKTTKGCLVLISINFVN
jgi:hypothetical protein